MVVSLYNSALISSSDESFSALFSRSLEQYTGIVFENILQLAGLLDDVETWTVKRPRISSEIGPPEEDLQSLRYYPGPHLDNKRTEGPVSLQGFITFGRISTFAKDRPTTYAPNDPDIKPGINGSGSIVYLDGAELAAPEYVEEPKYRGTQEASGALSILPGNLLIFASTKVAHDIPVNRLGRYFLYYSARFGDNFKVEDLEDQLVEIEPMTKSYETCPQNPPGIQATDPNRRIIIS